MADFPSSHCQCCAEAPPRAEEPRLLEESDLGHKGSVWLRRYRGLGGDRKVASSIPDDAFKCRGDPEQDVLTLTAPDELAVAFARLTPPSGSECVYECVNARPVLQSVLSGRW